MKNSKEFEELEHALQTLSESDIAKLNQQIVDDLEVGRSVQATLESDGWTKHIRPMIEDLLKRVDSVDGIATLNELIARQVTKSVLVTFFEGVDKLEAKKIAAEQLMAEQQLEEPDISPTT